jgi:hypothetical protein
MGFPEMLSQFSELLDGENMTGKQAVSSCCLDGGHRGLRNRFLYYCVRDHGVLTISSLLAPGSSKTTHRSRLSNPTVRDCFRSVSAPAVSQPSRDRSRPGRVLADPLVRPVADEESTARLQDAELVSYRPPYHSANASSARPRWEMAFFSSVSISANVFPLYSKIGS